MRIDATGHVCETCGEAFGEQDLVIAIYSGAVAPSDGADRSEVEATGPALHHRSCVAIEDARPPTWRVARPDRRESTYHIMREPRSKHSTMAHAVCGNYSAPLDEIEETDHVQMHEISPLCTRCATISNQERFVR